MPLLQSGQAWKVDWENEPLPNDPRFSITGMGWIPQATLRQRGGALGGRSAFGGRGNTNSATVKWNESRKKRGFGKSPPSVFKRRKRRYPMFMNELSS